MSTFIYLIPVLGAVGYISWKVFTDYRVSLFTRVFTILITTLYKRKDTPSCVINDKYMTIFYTLNNNKYSVNIPYDKRLATRAIGKKVYLICDDCRVDVTHQPGVPYLVKASDIGGNYYIVHDFIDDECTKVDPDELPLL